MKWRSGLRSGFNNGELECARMERSRRDGVRSTGYDDKAVMA